jgi:exodeoxyribonuclease VII large subunit
MPQSTLQFDDEETPRVLSVSELTAQIKDLLEGGFPAVQVSGELSNLSRPHSGHCYLTLKDEGAQLRAVIWRGTAQKLRFDLQDGLEVQCAGYLDVYAPRGSYQLVIQSIAPRGMGALELALRQLRARLQAEGLFDPQRKRPLPRFPRRVAVVTSPTGAAIHDFLQVLKRRWRAVEVLILPVRVQGEGSAQEIAAAIRAVDLLADPVDCLVVTRGGGSLEDLWSFNEEIVVRAIHAAAVPVVSGVGHEIDVTLSDLVADVRALTPSEAAERVVPSGDSVATTLDQIRSRLLNGLRNRAASARERLDALATHRVFRRPLDRVHESQRGIDELGARAQRAMQQHARHARHQVESLSARLESLSPLAVLSRGYSITRDAEHGTLVQDASRLERDQELITQFSHGLAHSRVTRIVKEDDVNEDDPTEGTDPRG